MTNTIAAENHSPNSSHESAWHLRLFDKSVLKQAKLTNIKRALGCVDGKTCLDLGSDNGVISYYLRREGGHWFSADLTEQAVDSISSLVGERVSLIDGRTLAYEDDYFDVVVLVDILEHVPEDAQFTLELARVLKESGKLVINAPNLKPYSALRGFRHLIGQTDEAHGHLRPGYGIAELRELFVGRFEIEDSWSYSGFCAEFIDTCIVWGYSILKRFSGGKKEKSEEVSKGLVVTEDELKRFEKTFKAYSKIYPLVWAFSRLDKLFWFLPGFMRLTVARKK